MLWHCNNLCLRYDHRTACLLSLRPSMSVMLWVMCRWDFSSGVDHPSCVLVLVLWCLFLISGSNVVAVYTCGVPTVRACTATTLQVIHMSDMCASWHWFLAHVRHAPGNYIFNCFTRGCLILLKQMFASIPCSMVGDTAFGAWHRVTWFPHIPHIMVRGFLFQIWYHLMTVTANLEVWVQWLGIRLIISFAPDQQNILF